MTDSLHLLLKKRGLLRVCWSILAVSRAVHSETVHMTGDRLDPSWPLRSGDCVVLHGVRRLMAKHEPAVAYGEDGDRTGTQQTVVCVCVVVCVKETVKHPNQYQS